MIGTLYEIRAKYVADTQAAEARVSAFAAANDKAAQKVGVLRGALSSIGPALLAGLGSAATLGIGLLTKKIVDLNRESQDAVIGIASVFSINGLGTFAQGMTRAKSLMKDFKKAAITSPGESRDLQNIFNRTAPTLARFNPSNKEITDFSSRGLAAAFTLMGGDVNTTGDQLSQIMMGQAGADNKLFQSIRAPLLENAGIKQSDPTKAVEAFNKLTAKDPRKVFDAINKTLQSLDLANEAFANTLTGRLASLSELSSMFLSTLGGPLMSRANALFGKLLAYADASGDKLDGLAKTIGEKLGDAFDRAQRFALMLYQNSRLLVGVFGAAAFRSGLGALSASGAMQSVGGFGGYVGGARRIAGSAGAGIAGVARGAARGVARAPGAALSFLGDMLFGNSFASAVGSGPNKSLGARIMRAPGALRSSGGAALRAAGAFAMSDPATHLRALEARRVAGGGLLNMARGSAPALAASAGIKGLVAGLGTLGTILVPLVIVVGMIAGTFRVLKDNANEATQFLHTAIGELRISLDTIAGQFGASGGFAGAVKSFADWLGTGVVGVMGVAVKAVAMVVDGFSWLVVMLKGIGLALGSLSDIYAKGGFRALTGDAISGAFSNGFIQAEKERTAAERSAYQVEAQRRKDAMKLESDQAYAKLADEAIAKAEEEKQKKEAEKLAKGAGATVNVTNQIQVITEADPDKIAIRLDRMNATSITDAIRQIDGIPGF